MKEKTATEHPEASSTNTCEASLLHPRPLAAVSRPMQDDLWRDGAVTSLRRSSTRHATNSVVSSRETVPRHPPQLLATTLVAESRCPPPSSSLFRIAGPPGWTAQSNGDLHDPQTVVGGPPPARQRLDIQASSAEAQQVVGLRFGCGGGGGYHCCCCDVDPSADCSASGSG
nr:hypothetical protein Iba_scaffold661257CG0010 [Ipomoea batatas]GMD07646.1 hypothetical protein Iba_chr06cCG9200 [Ipomoea batatas]GME20586.1 hypothetical protein Iba_scaffold25504CG0010 [Ipomoea batatas]